MLVRYRNQEYAILQRGEAWVIDVAGAQYFVTAESDPHNAAYRFLGGLPRNSIYPRTPAWTATPSHPLVLDLDGEIVRAWPAFVARNRPGWSATYINPRTGDRVLATEDDPRWMFAARGRDTTAGPRATGEQTIDDVADLARQWLQGIDSTPNDQPR